MNLPNITAERAREIMKNCLEIGIIQAFLDGELSGSEITRVSDHIGECDSCAMLLSQAEDENAVVFPALAREFDSMVPTQRLWTRIEGSIDAHKASAPWWEKAYALAITLMNPQVGAFAALLIVVALFAMYKLGGPAPVSDVAVTTRPSNAPVTRDVVPTTATNGTGSEPVAMPSRTFRPTVENASYRAPGRTAAQTPVVNAIGRPAANVDAAYLPGEESYVKTIASLSKTVNGDQDPNIMSASQQVSLARDMAVVDNTIERMRDAVKKNPKNDAAKQMLSTAYQNKIDLLSSVAQKQELVASIR
jgi:hypothetical protein